MSADLTRRRFLELTGAVAGAGIVGPMWLRIGEAAALEAGAAPIPGRKLVVLLLAGGNDGLNTVVPYTSRVYYARRPTIGQKPELVLKLNDEFGLHPALKSLHTQYHQGRVAVVQGVGYDEPDLSHFASMDVWQSASPTHATATGWLGRWLDATNKADAAIRAVSIGNELPMALVGEASAGVPVPSFGGFTFVDGRDTTTKGADVNSEPYRLHQAFLTCAEGRTGDRVTDGFLATQRTAVRAVRAINRMSDATTAAPQTFADQVSMAVKLLSSNLGVEIAFVSLGSFDDHAGEAVSHNANLKLVDDAIARFASDVAATGHADDYLLMTFSEFGRRVEENGGNGTDHGTAAPLFVVGNAVGGGLHGALPNLERKGLDEDGNMIRTVELREVYATVLDRWLGGPPSEQILRTTSKDGLHPIAFLR